jgi:hypothetical protein
MKYIKYLKDESFLALIGLIVMFIYIIVKN